MGTLLNKPKPKVSSKTFYEVEEVEEESENDDEVLELLDSK